MISRVALYVICVILVVVAIPMALRWVGPNGVYGFRTAQTLASPALWYKANSFAGWLLIATAGVMAMGAYLVPVELLARQPGLPLGILVAGLLVVVCVPTVYLAMIGS